MLTRVCLDDPGTVATLEATAHPSPSWPSAG